MKTLLNQLIPFLLISALLGISAYRMIVDKKVIKKALPDIDVPEIKKASNGNRIESSLKHGRLELTLVKDNSDRNLYQFMTPADTTVDKFKISLKRYDSVWVYGSLTNTDALVFLCKQNSLPDSLAIYRIDTKKVTVSKMKTRTDAIVFIDTGKSEYKKSEDSVYICRNCLSMK